MAKMRSVTQLLLDEYGMVTRPGQSKLLCPFCAHRTLSIKPDNALAKCFHPTCGRLLKPNNPPRVSHLLQTVLERVFTDFHRTLLAHQDGKAYQDLLSRGVHPTVIEEISIGEVPPLADYGEQLMAHFGTVVEQAKGKHKARLTEDHTKLYHILRGLDGWLVFGYLDEGYHFVGLKFRKPFTRASDGQIRYFKPFRGTGLFGRELFKPTKRPPHAADEFLLLSEGEYNSLQVQSLAYHITQSYIHAASVGGVENADVQLIAKVAKKPVLARDNDDGGQRLLEQMSKALAVEVFTFPEPGQDLDSFLRQFGTNYQQAWDALKDRIARKQRVKHLPKPHTISVQELVKKTFPPKQWVIEELIALKAVVILAGKQKVAKSYLVFDIALHVAGGAPIFNRTVMPGAVLYLALEDPEERLYERAHELCPDGQFPPGLDVITMGQIPRMHEGGLEQVEGWLSEHPTARLIIIDTIGRFRRPANIRKALLYDEDLHVIECFQHLAHRYHVAFLIVHHTVKHPLSGDFIDEVRDSVGLTGTADDTIVIRRLRHQEEGEMEYGGRNLPEKKYVVRFSFAHRTWSIEGEAEEEITAERKEILEVLEEAGEALSIKHLSEILGKPYGNVKFLLLKLCQEERVVRVSSGKYLFIPTNTPP